MNNIRCTGVHVKNLVSFLSLTDTHTLHLSTLHTVMLQLLFNSSSLVDANPSALPYAATELVM